jgi:hypothetical protein
MTMSMPKDAAFTKLANVMGAVEAESLFRETLKRIGRKELSSPDDKYAFGCALITRGGIFEAIGRAIKIQAILHGAADNAG